MLKPKKVKEHSANDEKFTPKDLLAMLIACFQILYPFILISIAVFTFVIWFLTIFWL